MRIAVSGTHGLIGRALVTELRAAGHSITRLVRNGGPQTATERVIVWNPERGVIDAAALEGHDAVVHLAGESLIGLWTQKKKASIRESRVRGTTLLARTIGSLSKPPRVFSCASAVGYYGDRPPEEGLDESASKGDGFLSDVVAEWEAAAQLAAGTTRVVNTRFGLVLSSKGGALAVMLPIFRLGIGGKVGTGRQIWSWISLDDVVRAIQHVLITDQLTGPVNFAAPQPVTNEVFTKALGQVLHRPTIFSAPGFAVRLVAQEMGEEMLLSGGRAIPKKLTESGFTFKHSELAAALKAVVR
jgi:uncharacterized protein